MFKYKTEPIDMIRFSIDYSGFTVVTAFLKLISFYKVLSKEKFASIMQSFDTVFRLK